MDIKLSIIIPAYNAEKTIQRAIDSVIEQYQTGVELIIVENGSTDSTQQVIDANAQKFPWIVALRSEKGASAARNRALDVAKGKYVTFLDADDVFTSNALDSLLKDINEQYDLVAYAIQMYGEVANPSLTTEVFKGDRIVRGKEKMIENPTRYMQVCASVFLKTIIDAHNLRFNTMLSMAEDSDFTMRFLEHTQSLMLSDNIIYFCPSDNANSLTRQANIHKVTQMLDSLHQTAFQFERSTMYADLQKAFSGYVLMNVNVIMVRQVYNVGIKQSKQQRKEQFKKVFEDRLVKTSMSNIPFSEMVKAVRLWPFVFYKLHLSFMAKLMFMIRSYQNNRAEKNSRQNGGLQ